MKKMLMMIILIAMSLSFKPKQEPHPCHPNGDLGPCTHALHPSGDLYPCSHTYFDNYGVMRYAHRADLYPCIHPAHSLGDIYPCIHVCL
jgi:hypothetical protein